MKKRRLCNEWKFRMKILHVYYQLFTYQLHIRWPMFSCNFYANPNFSQKYLPAISALLCSSNFPRNVVNLYTPGFRCQNQASSVQNQASGVQNQASGVKTRLPVSKSPPFHPESLKPPRHEIACDVSLKICKKKYLNHPQVMNLIEQVFARQS